MSKISISFIVCQVFFLQFTFMSILTIKNSQPTISSEIIANELGILHKATLQLIRKHQSKIELFGRVEFEMRPLETNGGVQETTICYLNENQAIFVGTLSKNTEKAVQYKAVLTQAFSNYKNQIQPSVPKEFSLDQLLEQNQNWIIKLSKKVETLETKIEEDKPAVQFVNQVNNAINSITVADFAKILGTGEIRLYSWLRENGYLQTRPKNRPYQKFIDIDKTPIFRVIEKTYKDQSTGESKTYFQTLINGKGQTYLTQKYQTSQSKFQIKILENS